MSFPAGNHATKNAILWLWAPNSIVLDGDASMVALAWGFAPKQLITWVKTDSKGNPRLGGGHYTRVCTEQLLLAVRGKPKILSHSIPDVILAPRRAHSAKPDESYRLIEQLCEGPRLELFARRRMPGWTAVGDQLKLQSNKIPQ